MPESDAAAIDLLLGRLALQEGRLTPDQLASCRREQESRRSRDEPVPRLGALLVQHGFCTRDELAAFLTLGDAGPAAGATAPTLRVAPTDPGRAGPGEPVPPATERRAPPPDSDLALSRPARPVAAPDPAGTAFGRYRLLQEVGRGGMGVVYLAWDEELKRRVALKTLLVAPPGNGTPDAGASAAVGPADEDVARFLREAQAAARLRHPNIVPVHDVGTHAGRHYFTMDFIEGESLAAAGRRLSPRCFLEVLRDVARALAAAHEAGVVHRDVKPANILLDRAGHPYVTDFGLAKQLEATERRELTAAGTILGTPQYLSPEQARGRSAEIGPASDVWSLGVILYEHLAGRLPFAGESLLNLVLEILQRDPPPPSRARAPAGSARLRRVHRDLDTITLKCLEKDPTRRYRSAGELAADLERFLGGEPIEARPPSFAYRAERWVARRRALAVACAAVVLVAAVAGSAAWRARTVEHQRADLQARLLEELRGKAELYVSTTLQLRRAGVLLALARDDHAAKLSAAVAAVDQVLPGLAEPHYHLGRMYRALGRAPDAVREQDEAVARAESPLAAPDDRAFLLPALYERGILHAQDYYLQKDEVGHRLLVAAAASAAGRGPAGVPPETSALRTARDSALADLGRVVALLPSQQRAGMEAKTCAARGVLASLRGRPKEEVEAELKRALKLDAGMEEVYAALADAARRRGEWRQAVAWYEEGHQADRGFVPHLSALAETLMNPFFLADPQSAEGTAAVKRAREAIDEALRLEPQAYDMWHRKAWLLHLDGRAKMNQGQDPGEPFAGSLSAAGQALRIYPQCVEASYCRGMDLAFRGEWSRLQGGDPAGDYAAALEAFDQALAGDPAYLQAHCGRANLLVLRGRWLQARGEDPAADYDRARAGYRVALGLDPRSLEGIHNQADVCLFSGDWRAGRGEDPTEQYGEARAGYAQVLVLDPGAGGAARNLAFAWRRQGDWEGSRGRDPTSAYGEAVAAYVRARALEPGSVEAANLQALTHKAIGEWRQAHGADPAGDYQRAVAVFEQAAALGPTFWEAHANRGVVLELLGRWDAAAAAYEAALKIRPGQPQVTALLEQVRRRTRDGGAPAPR